MRSILLLSLFICALFNNVLSQRACVFKEEIIYSSVLTGSEFSAPLPDIIIIPVVVHIIYNTTEQNISTEQVKSQIIVLNEDFRKKNSNSAFIPNAFKELAADSRIEFRLASIDPSGLPTNGIIRKSTSLDGFGLDDKIKSSIHGGDDPWNRDQYLNLWVGNLSGGVMGYASTPGCSAEKDGVVIKYTVFGTTPNIQAPYNKGRTTVHEVGHWLGLRHIWGDAQCGDDKIDDTPPQAGPTRGCPAGVVSTCTSGAAGNMYMNFMDFTNDECTNMFTNGQASKMMELFSKGGAREALLLSGKANGTIDGETALGENLSVEGISIYPNPAVNELNIRFTNTEGNDRMLIIYNHLGQVAKKLSITKNVMQVNVRDLKAGLYFISTGGRKTGKFIRAGR